MPDRHAAAGASAPELAVLSPVATGSGAIVVHRSLEQFLPGYRVVPYSPWWTLAPPALRWFGRARARVVHTALDYAVFVAGRRRPLVATLHNYVLDAFMRPFSSRLQRLHYATDLKWFTRMGLRRAAVVTAVSRFTAELLRSDLGHRGEVTVIPNGVDTARFSPAPAAHGGSEVRVLVSGNPTRRKGVQWLRQVADALPDGVVICCATGSARAPAPLEHPRIRFLGPIPHDRMPEAYRACDLLFMPTVREGMSLAALEAMACGLPVVASDVASMPELVQEGQGGYLCGLGDVAAYAERIRALAERPGARAAMGAHNRRRAERDYPLARMVERYRRVFEAL